MNILAFNDTQAAQVAWVIALGVFVGLLLSKLIDRFRASQGSEEADTRNKRRASAHLPPANSTQAAHKLAMFKVRIGGVMGLVILFYYYETFIPFAVEMVLFFVPCLVCIAICVSIQDDLVKRFPAIKKWLWIGGAVFLVGGLFSGAFLRRSFYDTFGSETPSALFEKSQYETRLFVYAYPEESTSKNYRVPALIQSYHDEYSYGDDGSQFIRIYKIKYFVFSNGVRVNFEDSEPLLLNKRVRVLDETKREWHIQMTAEHAK